VTSEGHVVRVQRSGIEILVPEDLTILNAAKAQGLIWPTLCKGNERCTRCYFEIISGEEALSPMSERERSVLARIRGDGEPIPGERLACCTYVSGDIEVKRPGVRWDSDLSGK